MALKDLDFKHVTHSVVQDPQTDTPELANYQSQNKVSLRKTLETEPGNLKNNEGLIPERLPIKNGAVKWSKIFWMH